MTRLLRSLVLLLVVGWSPAYAADWVNWYSGGAVLNLADALVIATDTDGSAAGAWSAAVAGDLSGRQLVLQLSSGDWSAVSQVEAVLSTSGNFEEYLHAELLPLLNALPEDDWIRLGVPAGVWHATPGADPRTVNAMVLRVRGEPGSTAQVGFTQPCFLRPSGGHGFITVSFDDGRTDVYEYAFPQLEARGLAGTVYAIPERVGTRGFMTEDQLAELAAAGWEIAAHGEHSLLTLSAQEREEHFRYASSWLAERGYGPRPNYSYPNGHHNRELIREVAEYFSSGRTINLSADLPGHVDAYRLGGLSVYPGFKQDQLEQLAQSAVEAGEWLNVVFHLFEDEPEVDTQFPPERFEAFLDFLVERNLPVRTALQAWQHNLLLSGGTADTCE